MTMERNKSTILGAYETTPVYHLKADDSGPTVVVVGGLHGNEVTGYQAAELIRLWTINTGEIYVIPRANQPAIEAGTRSSTRYDQPDMNRQFPTGQTPTHGIARGVWNVISRNNADYVFDLHRSRGLYRRSPSGVGMAIFPTSSGRNAADKSLQHLNVGHVPKKSHHFRIGNTQTGANPLLSHKVGGDLDPSTTGWLIETTYYDQNSYVQRDQLEHAVEALLYHSGSGIRVRDYGHHEHDPHEEVLREYDEDHSDDGSDDGDSDDSGGDGDSDSESRTAREIVEWIQSEYL